MIAFAWWSPLDCERYRQRRTLNQGLNWPHGCRVAWQRIKISHFDATLVIYGQNRIFGNFGRICSSLNRFYSIVSCSNLKFELPQKLSSFSTSYSMLIVAEPNWYRYNSAAKCENQACTCVIRSAHYLFVAPLRYGTCISETISSI